MHSLSAVMLRGFYSYTWRAQLMLSENRKFVEGIDQNSPHILLGNKKGRRKCEREIKHRKRGV